MVPRTPLLDPAGYFERRSDAFIGGTGIFVLYLMLEVAWLYFGMRLLFSQVTNLDPRVETEVLSIVTTILVVLAIISVVAWVVVAAVMHYGSGGSKTNGTFADAMGVAGWAYAPEIILFVPGVIYTWRDLQQRSFDGSNPEQLATQFETMAAQAELAAIPLLLSLTATVWSVYILAHGVSETHDVPSEAAALPAFVVGAGSILLWIIG